MITLAQVPRRCHRLALALMLGFAAGCQDSSRDAARPAPPSSAKQSAPKTDKSDRPTSTRHVLVGVVQHIDRETGIVRVRHEPIPDFMPAMTMPFSLAGQAVLDELSVGDHIRGTLVVSDERSELVDVVITAWADPESPFEQERKAALLKPGNAVPDFELMTQDGNSLKLSDLRGNVIALTFIYTRCPLPDFCPKLDRKFADLSRRVALLGARGEPVRLLSISFDPEHDSPETLRKHARLLGAQPPRWTFCVASHEELRRAAPAFGLIYGPGENEIIHTLNTAIIAPDGTLLALWQGGDWSVDEAFATIRKALPSATQR